jgi:uncharacterized damage-inducible protein DinB
MTSELFGRFAAYNRWANDRLYAACGELSEADYYAARPAFFGSIHRTLNHILVADRHWLARIEGQSLTGLALDAELYADRRELARARTAEDDRIVRLVAGLTDVDLAGIVRYRTTRGDSFEDPLALVLQHVFNHQTHHRGQVHDMLVATPVPPPPLDLIYFERARHRTA